MNAPLEVTDNISELLVKIIEFTKKRDQILTSNINNIHNSEYIPRDLEVEKFSCLLNEAIKEHACNQRLLLRDTENIKFGYGGNFEVKAVVDTSAKDLLGSNPQEYLEDQINRLMENSLNRRVATELLRQKHGMISIFG